jgi:hypothetical protein
MLHAALFDRWFQILLKFKTMCELWVLFRGEREREVIKAWIKACMVCQLILVH